MREIRAVGSMVELGSVHYRLDALEGCGSSAIVYRASYEDALSSGSRHQVLIKELFPLSPDGSIFRNEDGSVAYTEDAGDLMEISRSRFLMGNQVNLALLQQSPGGTSGNINSFEAYGTYYSVLSLHGGRNLKDLLQETAAYPMREAVAVMERILAALEIFHANGLLHLDISPDNILLLPEQALLIDYNSVWDTRYASFDSFAFSEKQGYSAPEVKTHTFQSIGFSTDLFSVCAVFFHMLMGRPLRNEELMGTGLRRSLAVDLATLWQVPQSVAAKAAQILLRGLHSLPRKRYGSVSELREDLEELRHRLEGKGITRSALWEVSHAALMARKQDTTRYLPQAVTLKSGETVSQSGLYDCLAGGGCYLLTGPGGMGKTRALVELWKKSGTHWQPGKPLVLYFSLKDYQQMAGEGQFLRRSLLKGLRFSEKDSGYADAMHVLEGLLNPQQEKKEGGIILLLDGLNEAGRRQERLLLEIEALGRKPGIGILVTDRSDGVLSYGLEGFQAAELAPLRQAQMEEALAAASLVLKPEMSQLLSNPMMLFLYIDAMASGLAEGETPETPDGLVRRYLESFCRKALREDSGDQGKQLCSRYLLEHLLPEIAAGMQRSRKTVLTFEELCRICDKSYRELSGGAFGEAFPEYRGKTRLMLAGISSGPEWYDLAVNEGLIGRFGLLVQTGNGYFGLLHDNFQQTLGNLAEQNQKAKKAARRKALRKKVPLICGAAMLLMALGWGLVRFLPGMEGGEPSYTQAEAYTIREGVNSMNLSLGKWSSEITAQRFILSEAESSDVLDNRDPRKKANLEEFILRKQEELAHYPVSPMEEDSYGELIALQEKYGQFPLEQWTVLYQRHAVLEADMTVALEYLRQRLCTEDSLYISLGQQEAMVKAYQQWLDAEVEYISYELAILLGQLPEEMKDEVWKAMESMAALNGFAAGPGTMPPDVLERGLPVARRNLRVARDEMLNQGFPIVAIPETEEKGT